MDFSQHCEFAKNKTMEEHKRIILVGPAGSGKDFIRNKFREKGYKVDVSYTTRPPREGEENGIDYKFISAEQFAGRVYNGMFYECVQHGKFHYGTGLSEWQECDVFIMETDGVKHITSYDRQNCLIIYVNTPFDTRLKRLRDRGWSDEKISDRVQVDHEKFRNFNNYDFEISSEAHD